MNFALLGEGSSDRCLLPLLQWVLRRATPAECVLEWVDTTRLPPARRLRDKVRRVLVAQPCDLLFVHRDADRTDVESRVGEIADAATGQAHVAVVPVRMTETWLLFDDGAIRAAAGRVSGREPLRLPTLKRLEDLASPKEELRRVLTVAAGVSGRRRGRFQPALAMHRLADLVDDWSPLRQLAAFRRLEADTRAALDALGLPLHPDES